MLEHIVIYYLGQCVEEDAQQIILRKQSLGDIFLDFINNHLYINIFFHSLKVYFNHSLVNTCIASTYKYT